MTGTFDYLAAAQDVKVQARNLRLMRGDELSAAERVIADFNADDSKTHRSNPDSREHYYARKPILATDCDYEIVGFSGVQGRMVRP